MDTMIEKLDLKSMNITEERLRELKQFMPEVFTEDLKIDFEKLKLALGRSIDTDKERYSINWPGKSDAFKNLQIPSIATLKPCREESVDFDTTQNIFIEGDNLEVLKLLQKSYIGKIKMIYIDPPYNTGNEFIYPDNYSESLDTYLEYSGQVDATGKKFSTNTDTDGRFHSKWLSMMYPRLYLARNLLKDDGVIFISIDDHELINLRKICDEIFGEEDFLGQIIWKNVTDNNPTNIAIEHEYIVVYAKDKNCLENVWKSKYSDIKKKLLEVERDFIQRYSDPETLQAKYSEWFRENKFQLGPLDRYKYIDQGGIYTGSQSVHNPGKEGYRYDVVHPITNKPCKEPLMGYRFAEDTMKKLLSENKILFGEDENKIIELKLYASEYEHKLSSVIELDGRLGSYDLRLLFPENTKLFNNPKPVTLLKDLCDFVLDTDSYILDFFSGSGTTAHAVMSLNAEDNGMRKCISIQLPEPLEEKTEAYKYGYKTIADITKERIKRMAKMFFEEKKKTEQPLFQNSKFDVGVKIYKLANSNFIPWKVRSNESANEVTQQIQLAVNHIDSRSSSEDLLYEILLKSGFELTVPINRINIVGKEVYSIEDGVMLVCLEDEITSELIQAVKQEKPSRFICKDSAFQNNDALKTNAVHTFKAVGEGQDEGIQFRTI